MRFDDQDHIFPVDHIRDLLTVHYDSYQWSELREPLTYIKFSGTDTM